MTQAERVEWCDRAIAILTAMKAVDADTDVDVEQFNVKSNRSPRDKATVEIDGVNLRVTIQIS